MCIIAYKPKGQALPSKETLQMCWNNNEDGAGYMFANDGRVWISKGFATFDKFYNKLTYDYKRYNLKSKNLVLHFRIGTSGGITPAKTHPFPLTDNVKQLNATRTSCKYGVAHNGILSDYVYADGKTSDTQNFIKDFLAPILKLSSGNLANALTTRIIDKELAGDKLIILNKNDTIYKYGDWQHNDADGCYYSNATYKTERYNYMSTLSGWDNWREWGGTTYEDTPKTTTYYDNYDQVEYDYIKKHYTKVKDSQLIVFDDGYEFTPAEMGHKFDYYVDEYDNLYELEKHRPMYSLIATDVLINNGV